MLVILASFPDLGDLPVCTCDLLSVLRSGLCISLPRSSETLLDALELAKPSWGTWRSTFCERWAMARNSGKVTAETGFETWATSSPSESVGGDTLVPSAAFFFSTKTLRFLWSALTSSRSKPAVIVFATPSNEFKVSWRLESCGEASCSWRAVSPSSDNSGTSFLHQPGTLFSRFSERVLRLRKSTT